MNFSSITTSRILKALTLICLLIQWIRIDPALPSLKSYLGASRHLDWHHDPQQNTAIHRDPHSLSSLPERHGGGGQHVQSNHRAGGGSRREDRETQGLAGTLRSRRPDGPQSDREAAARRRHSGGDLGPRHINHRDREVYVDPKQGFDQVMEKKPTVAGEGRSAGHGSGREQLDMNSHHTGAGSGREQMDMNSHHTGVGEEEESHSHSRFDAFLRHHKHPESHLNRKSSRSVPEEHPPKEFPADIQSKGSDVAVHKDTGEQTDTSKDGVEDGDAENDAVEDADGERDAGKDEEVESNGGGYDRSISTTGDVASDLALAFVHGVSYTPSELHESDPLDNKHVLVATNQSSKPSNKPEAETSKEIDVAQKPEQQQPGTSIDPAEGQVPTQHTSETLASDVSVGSGWSSDLSERGKENTHTNHVSLNDIHTEEEEEDSTHESHSGSSSHHHTHDDSAREERQREREERERQRQKQRERREEEKKLDPTKYERDGTLRESFILRHLPQVPKKCAAKKETVMPDLDGLPVSLPTHIPLENMFVHRENVQSLFGEIGTVGERLLPESGEAIMKKFKWRSCAVVGNSGNLLNARYATVIDKHDVVMRLNQAPVIGYEGHVGGRTTFRLLNNMWLHRYSSQLTEKDNVMWMPWEKDMRPLGPTELPLEKAVTLIITRYTAEEAEKIIRFWDKRRSDVQILMLNSRVVSVVRQLLQLYRVRLCKAGYGPYEGGTVPSSGLVATYMLLQMCKSVTTYGFGSPGEALGKRSTSYHYYKMWGARPVGNVEAHSFDMELALMKEILSPRREHPQPGHYWWRPSGEHYGNVKMCRPNDRGPLDISNYWCTAGELLNSGM